MAGMAASPSCIFCQIVHNSTTTTLLHTDEKVVAFQDINPSAFRHYLVIPVEHIATVKSLRRRTEDYSLVSHMLNVGQTLLQRDAPNSTQYRWKTVKYTSLGPLGGFIEARKLLEKLKP
ncbi:bifunctional adenosine 5'-phosphosulfate phosphorylase/adenylylsulfatase HINT4 isoform X3 [Lactuca sativa]|uniref:bifunctional adenosine 5'-phosphosulfate phosphorylase/adenylylsulfatase HINT4 isoform X3 n=1 Tax=Lactuca sativa TaxID=4236 RepID=UPI000CD83DE7|nr:bifunctional adenosine 5'-phosphosulfate phosphorylase/adenylylsulfatase HINT4 isoform X3 [Lactuca sativa]